MTQVTIAVDAMGGDHGPRVVVPAVLQALRKHSNLKVILVGREEQIEQQLQANKASLNERLEIRNTPQVVGMDEQPAMALRSKKQSSMRVGIDLVKHQEADACVSAGNTGALMAIGRFVLKMLPGVDRPAIIYSLPTIRNRVHMLDLGANVDCQADHLFQFAVMGSVLASAIDGNPSPKVALLNIGAEAIKGSEQVKRVAQLLQNAPRINYVGYIEGDELYKGTVDVVVCDGFVGNVALKVSEGLARMLLQLVKQAFMHSFFTRLLGWMVKPVMSKLLHRYDPRTHNGASLLGLKGIIIKSHGSADADAFYQAIYVAVREVEQRIPTLIREEVSEQLGDWKTA